MNTTDPTTSTRTSPRPVPFKEGLLHIPESADDTPYLIGSRCRECEWVTFPARRICPACVKDGLMEEAQIGRHAKLVSFAVVHQAPAGFEAPFIQANVQLEEGPVVFARVDGVEPRDDALVVGEDMDLTFLKIREDADGRDVVAWAYRPVSARA